jgi:hypothetical protein
VPRNPFRPTFGSPPPLLAGRDDLIEEFVSALEDGPGAPGRATLYTGVRGIGKTVLLNAVEARAKELGWIVVSETATSGLLHRLVTDHLPRLLKEVGPSSTKTRPTGISLPASLGGVTWQSSDTLSVTTGLRTLLFTLADWLDDHGTGILLSVGEVHRHLSRDLVEICTVLQHAFREERAIAFVAAGLPSSVDNLLTHDPLTFLQRADRHPLGEVDLAAVTLALRKPIEDNGRTISAANLQKAARATRGYPFLIQLIGYHIWRQHSNHRGISTADVDTGLAAAHRRLGTLVHAPILKDLSHVDRTFLVAMAQDDGPATQRDIAARLGTTGTYASQYRLRLIQAQIIHATQHGKVDFAISSLREALREHAASLGIAHLQPKRGG